MKLNNISIRLIFMIITIHLLECSLPDVVEPAEWMMHVEFPLTDQKISIGSILSQKPISDLQYDSSGSGDTLLCVRSDSVEYTFEQQVGFVDSAEFSQQLGTFTLDRMKPVTVQLKITDNIEMWDKPALLLYNGVTLSHSEKNITIDGVSYIMFDESSPDLEITLFNQTAHCDLDDLVIAMLDHDDVLAVVHVPHITVKEKVTVKVPVAGKKIRSPFSLALSALIPGGTIVHESDQVSISISFNKMVVSEAEIEDIFVNYNTSIAGIIPIADSLKIDHLETDNVALELNVRSPARLKMKLSASFYNSQDREILQPEMNNFVRNVRNAPVDPSSYMFKGDTITALLDSNFCSLYLPIGAMQLFPGFDKRSSYSTIGCAFNFTIVHEGNRIRFNKKDHFSLKARFKNLPLKRIKAAFLKKLECSGTTAVNSGLSTTDENMIRLQNTLTFKTARLELDLDPGMIEGCSLDSIQVQAVMKTPEYISDSVVLTQTLTDITYASHHTAMMDFTSLFNRWPDTFTFDVKLLLPKGTGFKIDRMDKNYEILNTTLSMKPVLKWKVVVPLCWKIDETTCFELEKTEITLTEEQISAAKKIKNPSLKIMMNIFNQTNLSSRMYALGAVKGNIESLMGFPDSLKNSDYFSGESDHAFFSVTGKEGIVLAPRNNVSLNEVIFDAQTVKDILDDGHCVIRWFLFLNPASEDALKTTDYIMLKAGGMIDGIGNTDLLTKI
ncbi:MAG: hypothetical protein JW915_16900 [Chitinispirillaceae bacterium]|nr:hypothetical protein [Chitinispirillaceae bacterium]